MAWRSIASLLTQQLYQIELDQDDPQLQADLLLQLHMVLLTPGQSTNFRSCPQAM